jgi:hypothetical protein
LRQERPLLAGAEAGAAATAQARRLHLADDRVGRHAERLLSASYAPLRERGVDRPRVVGRSRRNLVTMRVSCGPSARHLRPGDRARTRGPTCTRRRSSRGSASSGRGTRSSPAAPARVARGDALDLFDGHVVVVA